MSDIEETVLPAFAELGYKTGRQSDEVYVSHVAPTGVYYVHVSEFPGRCLLLLRAKPYLFVTTEEVSLLESALGLNCHKFLVKLGRYPTTGQLVIECELPTRQGMLTKDHFRFYYTAFVAEVNKVLPILARVRYGRISPTEAMDTNAHVMPPPRKPRKRKTKVERQVDALLKRLDRPNPQEQT